MNIFVNFISLIMMSCLLLSLVGCSKKETTTAASTLTADPVATTISFSGTINPTVLSDLRARASQKNHDAETLKLYATKESRTDSDFIMNCTTLEAAPSQVSTNIATDGTFTIEVPIDTPFSCAVDAPPTADADPEPVFSIKIEDATQTLADGITPATTDGIALNADVTLTAELEPTNYLATISSNELTDALSTVTAEAAPIVASDIHGKYFKVTCIDWGDANAFARCKLKFMTDWSVDPAVEKQYAINYMRVIEATRGADSVNMLAIWNGYGTYESCGSNDIFTDQHSTSAESCLTGSHCADETFATWISNVNGITLSDNTSGSWTDNDVVSCLVRERNAAPNSIGCFENPILPANLHLFEAVSVGADGSWNTTQSSPVAFIPEMNGNDCTDVDQILIHYNTRMTRSFTKQTSGDFDYVGIAEATSYANPTNADISGYDRFVLGYEEITEEEAAVTIPDA